MSQSLGMIELSSVAIGHLTLDSMLKAANVRLTLARSICSGKFICVVGGDVAAVQASVAAGVAVSSKGGALIEQLVIPNIHPQVFPAMADCTPMKRHEWQSLGMVETFSAASIIESADAAAKASSVTVFRIRVAMALGGKGFLQLTGDVAAVQSAVNAGARMAGGRGMLVATCVIPNPHPDLFREYV